MKIGVIGVQGAVSEHIEMTNKVLKELEIDGEAFWLKTQKEALECNAFIIPGGESTTITDLMKRTGLWNIVKTSQKPIMGTCAGLVILSKAGMYEIEKTGQELMGLLNCKVNRNAFGRQKESFEAELNFNNSKITGVFIRAPAVEEVYDECKALCDVEGRIVGVEEGNVIGFSFHPDLTEDLSIHKYFINKLK